MSHDQVKLCYRKAAAKTEFDAAVTAFQAALMRGVAKQADKRRREAHDRLDEWLDASTELQTHDIIEAHKKYGDD